VAVHYVRGFARLFISRSIGNVVPKPSQDVDGVTATIEYAVEVLKVRHAIVCGHSDCGALKAALDRKSLENLPKAQRWLEHVEAAFAYRQPLNPADGESAELASLIRGNVVAQLKNLEAQAPVRHAMAEGRLTVHAGGGRSAHLSWGGVDRQHLYWTFDLVWNKLA
jgi:carbonic anhydrase